MQRYLLLIALLFSFSFAFAQSANYNGVYVDEERTTGYIISSVEANDDGVCLEVHHDIFDDTGVTVYRESAFADCPEKEHYRTPFDSQTQHLVFSTDKKGNKVLKVYHQGDLIGTYKLDPDFQVILSDIDIMYADEEIIDENYGYMDAEVIPEDVPAPPFYLSAEGVELYFSDVEENVAGFSLMRPENENCPENGIADVLELSDKDPNTYVLKADDCILLSFKVEADRIVVTEYYCSDSQVSECDRWSGIYVKND